MFAGREEELFPDAPDTGHLLQRRRMRRDRAQRNRNPRFQSRKSKPAQCVPGARTVLAALYAMPRDFNQGLGFLLGLLLAFYLLMPLVAPGQ